MIQREILQKKIVSKEKNFKINMGLARQPWMRSSSNSQLNLKSAKRARK
jgi:hypothetical protein